MTVKLWPLEACRLSRLLSHCHHRCSPCHPSGFEHSFAQSYREVSESGFVRTCAVRWRHGGAKGVQPQKAETRISPESGVWQGAIEIATSGMGNGARGCGGVGLSCGAASATSIDKPSHRIGRNRRRRCMTPNLRRQQSDTARRFSSFLVEKIMSTISRTIQGAEGSPSIRITNTLLDDVL